MALRSWVVSANGHPDFPLENLPLGRFKWRGETHHGVAIGDSVFDLCHPERERGAWVAGGATLAQPDVSLTLEATRRLLHDDAPNRDETAKRLIKQTDVEMLLPVDIGDYTDFYASIHHATNVGSMFRPDNPLLPNYKWIPIGYHGRASSIVVSGTPFHRPKGQTRDDASQPPLFGPTKRLDYELEVGVVIGKGNDLGESIPIDRANDHILGLCIVNDWSARDVQTWEYQPLGPFLAKNFATSISPWVVTLDALAPFRADAPEHDDAPLLPYLSPAGAAYDITLEVWLRSAKMNAPVLVSRGNFRDMYWTVSQLVAHHASNGCNLRTGDLLASGTVSGTTKESRGCLLERTWRGTEPLELPNGEQRRFLEDGDEVIMRAYCERDGATRVGFGECRGTVLPPI
jgi:fumarylacetoacetase